MADVHPLRAYRDRVGVSAADFAAKAGTTRQTIHRIENGRQEVSIALVRRIVTAANGEVSGEAILAACLNAAPTADGTEALAS